MRNEIKRTINGKEYLFYQFGASQGLKVWVRLVKLVGNSVGILASDVINKGGLKADVGTLKIDKAIESLCLSLDEDDTLELVKEIFSQVMYKGQRLDEVFDAHFQSDYMSIFEIIKIALEVNYKDFLLKLSSKLGLGREK